MPYIKNVLKICLFCGQGYYITEYVNNLNRSRFCSKLCSNEYRKIHFDKNWLFDMYITNMHSCYKIADIVGCSSKTVQNKLKQYGIPLRTTNKGSILEETLIKLYFEDNLTTRQIALLFNRDKASILYWFKKYNINLRNKSESKKGRKPNLSPERRKEISDRNSGENNPMWGKFGPEHPAWKEEKDRRTILYDSIRSLTLYKKWRIEILSRDGNKCVICGITDVQLNVDHIKSFALIIKENNITDYLQAVNCNELWNIDNGRTLCVPCHKLTDSYGVNNNKLLKENK